MSRTKTNQGKDKITLYLDSKKIEKAQHIAIRLNVPISFIFDDILKDFLKDFEDDFAIKENEEEEARIEMEDFYKWKLKRVVFLKKEVKRFGNTGHLLVPRKYVGANAEIKIIEMGSIK